MNATRSPDEERFHAFEQAGWDGIPAAYHHGFGDLTTQAIEPLLDAVGATKVSRLLDVATGPGYVASAAAKRGAEVIGLDFAAAMVAEARLRHPAMDFREGDAEDLPFLAGAFDAVIMNFGILHLAKPDQAIAEARRVLRSGGRFAFTCWEKPEATVGFGIVLNAVRAYGTMDVVLPTGPPFFRFGDPQECRRSLGNAGFVEPSVTRVPLLWRLRSSDALFAIMFGGTVRTAGLLRAQSKDALNTIRSAVREAVNACRKGDVFELPMPAVLASAAKP